MITLSIYIDVDGDRVCYIQWRHQFPCHFRICFIPMAGLTLYMVKCAMTRQNNQKNKENDIDH